MLAQYRSLATNHEWLYALLLATVVFLAPTNLFYKFWETGSYIHGLQVDYLIGKLYLSQAPVFALLGVWLFKRRTGEQLLGLWQKPSVKFLACLLLFLGVRQLFTTEPLVSLWHWFNLGVIALLIVFLRTNLNLTKHPLVLTAFVVTVIFQSVVALAQYAIQHELLGFLFFGEPDLSQSIGIARFAVFGSEKILPYGTTAHPNVLAGFLAVYSLMIILIRKHQKLGNVSGSIALAAIVLGMAAMAATTSLSGVATFFIGFFYLYIPQKYNRKHISLALLLVTILIPIGIHLGAIVNPKNQSLTRRSYLQQAGLGIFADNILLGTGLQTVTRSIEAYSRTSEVVRFTQPPHHVGILLASETGVIGVLLLLYLCTFWTNASLLLLIPLFTLDHYLFTLWPGLLLLSLATTVFTPQKTHPKASR